MIMPQRVRIDDRKQIFVNGVKVTVPQLVEVASMAISHYEYHHGDIPSTVREYLRAIRSPAPKSKSPD